jgi:hypothetical protein
MVKVSGGNPITITETAEIPISIYSPYVLLKTRDNKNFAHKTCTKRKQTHLTKTNRNITLNQEKGYFVLHFLSLSFIFSGTKRRTKNNKSRGKFGERESKVKKRRWTLMLFKAGLFKRFKCLWTSSFCRETLNLAAQDKEISPHKQKSTAKTLLVLPLLLNCAPPIS